MVFPISKIAPPTRKPTGIASSTSLTIAILAYIHASNQQRFSNNQGNTLANLTLLRTRYVCFLYRSPIVHSTHKRRQISLQLVVRKVRAHWNILSNMEIFFFPQSCLIQRLLVFRSMTTSTIGFECSIKVTRSSRNPMISGLSQFQLTSLSIIAEKLFFSSIVVPVGNRLHEQDAN